MNLGAVLLTGLFAGGLSCAAVQGGLLAGLVARQRDAAQPSGSGRRRKAKPALEPTWRQRLADDLAPVSGFLAGKLVSHTLLGVLLGALGSAVQLSPRVTALTQIVAGLLIVVFGLAQLGVPGLRNLSFEPPASWTRFVRGQARSRSALAPAMLGAATVVIPCGVTLSVMALAVTSGSPLWGAATMAVFVIGTSPLFAALGYLARKAATSWQGRLATVTGLVVLLLGLYTLNTGLERAESPVTAKTVAQSLGLVAEPPSRTTVSESAGGRQEVVVMALTGAYTPGNVAVKAGVPTTLVVRSKNAQGCVRAFVIPSLNKQWVLPENGDTRIDLGKLKPGTVEFSCSMGMYTGQLTVS